MGTKTALLSVYNKDGLEDFAHILEVHGWQILASSGTAKYLKEKGVQARDVAEIVGPPILGHRVVTLSREIHAGLLAQDTPEDQAELDRLGIPWIDLVYVNLYPLVEEMAREGCTLESVIEKTDIGGPALLRSAAKGGRIVLCRPEDVGEVSKFLSLHQEPPPELILRLAAIAEFDVSAYCLSSSNFLYHYQVD